MSRSDAMKALGGAGAGEPVIGVTWLSERVFAGVDGDAGVVGVATVARVLSGMAVDFAFVDAESPDATERVAALHSADIAVGWAVGGPFGRVAERLGWAKALRISAEDPGLLTAPLTEALARSEERVRQGVAAGADFLVVAEDLASEDGWLVAPGFARVSLLPSVCTIAQLARRLGVHAVFHSDGDVSAIFDALAAGGFDALHVTHAPGKALESVLTEASRHCLGVLGGVQGRGLETSFGEDARRALYEHAHKGLLVCDDGGIVSARQLSRLAQVYRELKRRTEA